MQPRADVVVQLQPAGGGKRKQEAKKEQGAQVQILIIVLGMHVAESFARCVLVNRGFYFRLLLARSAVSAMS